jgi:hypothetical protein
VIQPQQVQDRGVQVVNLRHILDRFHPHFRRCAVKSWMYTGRKGRGNASATGRDLLPGTGFPNNEVF